MSFDSIVKILPIALRRACCYLLLLLCSFQLAQAAPQDSSKELPDGFVTKSLKTADGLHHYVVFVPPGYSAEDDWPVVLFLHGAGQKGTDGIRPIIAGLGTALAEFPDQRFIAVFPQCENQTGRHLTCWLAESEDTLRALEMLKEVEREYSIDSTRRVLCGWSMGGFGAWSLAAKQPDFWAGVLSISGGQTENKLNLNALAKQQTPVWAVHGQDDSLIPFHQAEEMIEALNASGGRGTFTMVNGVGHNVWRYLFTDPRSLQWLSNPASINPAEVKDFRQNPPLPLVSQFYINQYTHLENLPDMLSIRMGNSALEVISQGIPEVIPPSALSGQLEDIERSITSRGETIHVKLADIEFDCTIAGVQLKAISGGRFLANFQMNPLRLSIGTSSLESESTRAKTGPFEIKMGHREPVSLELELQPSMGENGLELLPLNQKFTIPESNWHIVPPQKIEVNNTEFSDANIVTGIVGGLYLQREQIEKTILEVVPSFLDVVEAELRSREAPKLAQLLWPLPALIPDLTVSPSQVRTDKSGISLVFDMQIRTFHPRIEGGVSDEDKRATNHFDASKLPETEELDFQVSLEAVDGIGRRVINEGFAYINLLDLQNAEFAKLTKPEVLHKFFPTSIPRNSEHLWDVGIRLKEPFHIGPADRKSSSDEVFVKIFVPNVAFEVRDQNSNLIAALHFSLLQVIQIQTNEVNGVPESLKVTWLPDPEIAVLAETSKTAVNDAEFAKQFTQAWLEMSKALSEKKIPIPRVKFGNSALALKSFIVSEEVVSLKFTAIRTEEESQ